MVRFLWIPVVLTVAACAVGTQLDTSGSGGSGGIITGTGASGGASSSSSSSSSSKSASVTSSSANASATASSTTGTGGDASTSVGSGGGGGGAPDCFDSPNTCAAAEEIPSIAGDTGADLRSASGATSKWFKLLVREDVGSPFSFPALSFTATLTAPAGASFDLYVYDGDGSGVACGSFGAKGSGAPESYSMTWGDSVGSDDTRWVGFEVRYVSGDDCNGTWSLTVAGNTQ